MLKIDELKKYSLIYIIGHKHTDADSAVSSYLLSRILNESGIKCEYAVLDHDYELVFDDVDLINDHFDYKPTIIKDIDIDNSFFILVDHNNPIQSIGIGGNVVGIIDHHFLNTDVSNCIIGEYASTASVIYETYKDFYSFNVDEKRLIFLAILSDTAYFRTSRYKKKDVQIVEELNSVLKLDPDKLRKKYFKTNDFTMEVSENFYSNYKKYKFDQLEFECSSVRAKKDDYKYLADYIKYLQKITNNWLFVWYDYDTSKTYAYYKINKNIKVINYDFIASRANNIIKDVIKL